MRNVSKAQAPFLSVLHVYIVKNANTQELQLSDDVCKNFPAPSEDPEIVDRGPESRKKRC